MFIAIDRDTTLNIDQIQVLKRPEDSSVLMVGFSGGAHKIEFDTPTDARTIETVLRFVKTKGVPDRIKEAVYHDSNLKDILLEDE